jgi:hypothetical protein
MNTALDWSWKTAQSGVQPPQSKEKPRHNAMTPPSGQTPKVTL